MKGLDRSIYEISVLHDFRLFELIPSTSFSNDDFSPFDNTIKEERLLRNETLSLKLRYHN